jgi:transposase-like protein
MDPVTLQEATLYFANPDNCREYMVARRWPDGKVTCPTCGNQEGIGFLKAQNRWQCRYKHPKRQFSLKTGTIFEDSPIGLDKWLLAMWLICNCKNGVSSYEISRDVKVTQKTAWFMLQRIRQVMQDEVTGGKLGGPMGSEVEVDETYIGGAARNMHKNKKAKVMKGRRGGSAHKAIVLGVLERKGKVRAKVIDNTTNPEMRDFVKKNVEFGSRVHSDEAGMHWKMDQHYIHEMVNHSAEEYVRENVHTNGIENFWALLKRGISGTYVSVEPFHLFRYVDEQAFRFNNRLGLKDGDRFSLLCEKVVGKRLTYSELTGKEAASQASAL